MNLYVAITTTVGTITCIFCSQMRWISGCLISQMNKQRFLAAFRECLTNIKNEAFYLEERGYQGQLITELDNRMKAKVDFRGDDIVQQEYQKSLKNHGIRIRPDIIIHTPYRKGINRSRRVGNYVVILLKNRSSRRRAREDFDKLNLMFEKLCYPLGIFLNINADRNFCNAYNGIYKSRLHCFAVKLINGEVIICESPPPIVGNSKRKQAKTP